MNNPSSQNPVLSARRRQVVALLLFVGAVAGLLFLLPRRSFTVNAEKEAAPQQGRGAGQSKRLFIHDKNHIRSSRDKSGRLTSNCDECHRIPGSFIKAESPLGYNVREFPDHPDCLRCHEHRKDFFRGGNPPICTVCHKGSTPREGNPGLFPKAGGPDVEKDFTGRFPHDKHQDILAHNAPVRSKQGFGLVKAAFQPSAQDKVTRADCSRCHESYPADIEKQMLTNINWEAFEKANNLQLYRDETKTKLFVDAEKTMPLLDSKNNLPLGMIAQKEDSTTPLGTFRQSPNGPTGHKYCFECHAQTQGAWNSPFPRANDCVGCHGLGRALEAPPKPDLQVFPSKTVTPLTLTAAGNQAVRDGELLKKYGFFEVPKLMPRISYKFQHDISQHQIECTSCHINIIRQQTLNVRNPDVPMASCAICHANNGGKNINVGTVALKLDDEIASRRKNPQHVCVACHTPDTGRNPPPDSHYAVLGQSRF